MDPGSVTGICIIIAVFGIVFWLPMIVLFPLIKSIADRIAGRSPATLQISELQKKILILEHEVSELRTRQLSLEDSHRFDQELIKKRIETERKS